MGMEQYQIDRRHGLEMLSLGVSLICNPRSTTGKICDRVFEGPCFNYWGRRCHADPEKCTKGEKYK